MTEAADALEIARRVAREAAGILRGVSDVGAIRTKTTFKDLVTEWDTRVDDAISRLLAELTPDIPRLAEESGAHGDVGESGTERQRIARNFEYASVGIVDHICAPLRARRDPYGRQRRRH